MTTSGKKKTFAFPRRHRLTGRRLYQAVYDTGWKLNRNPLLMVSRPNDLAHCRWGLSISRKVGNAVVRNRIKRLIREAIRLGRHDFPVGYDLILIIRPHKPLRLADYQGLLAFLTSKTDEHWGNARQQSG